MHSSLSLLSLLQYALLALVAYVLAGAPLLTLLSGGGTSGRRDAVNSGNASLVLEMLAIPQPGLRCEEHKFTGVHVLRTEPLVVYIEGFLSEEEAREIVNVRYVFGLCVVGRGWMSWWDARGHVGGAAFYSPPNPPSSTIK
jgi:prolyl 4-hydroxylase